MSHDSDARSPSLLTQVEALQSVIEQFRERASDLSDGSPGVFGDVATALTWCADQLQPLLVLLVEQQRKDMESRVVAGVPRESAPTGSTASRNRVVPTELGCPGHFIAARSCRWRRHTQVGDYRVSSVGDYYPDHKSSERETIGAGDDSFFETMVFKTNGTAVHGSEGCGCVDVESWSEIDGTRYATAGEAQAGHERYVRKYLARSL